MTHRIILSGPFCTGKTNIIEMLSQRFGIPKFIDETTRSMRPHEREGFPYHFITRELFQQRLADGYYFETVDFNGQFYGVPRRKLFEQASWSLDILASSWPNYAGIPGVIGIYLEPPSVEVLVERARKRGDTPDQIAQRLELMRLDDGASMPYKVPPQPTLESTFHEIEKLIQKFRKS